MNVILIGYRGTGKTSVGRLLAAKLGRLFLDSDELIKSSSGKSVREMVAEKGWGYFRQEEKRVVARLAANDDCVVALGGGAVLDEENVRNLKPKGFFIWLTADAQLIVGRLNGDGKSFEQRPPLAGKDPDRIDAPLVFAAAARGDPVAVSVVAKAAQVAPVPEGVV